MKNEFSKQKTIILTVFKKSHYYLFSQAMAMASPFTFSVSLLFLSKLSMMMEITIAVAFSQNNYMIERERHGVPWKSK